MNTKTLLVVYDENDEEIFNYIKALIDVKDDEAGNIVGTEDGSVRVIKCLKEKWAIHQERGHVDRLADKFLFIGNIISTPNTSFNRYGISYGAYDNKIALNIDAKYKWSDEEYYDFENEVASMLGEEVVTEKRISQEEKKKKSAKNNALIAAGAVLFAPLAVYGAVAKTKEVKEDKEEQKKMRYKMLVYGANKLYYEMLDKFIKE